MSVERRFEGVTLAIDGRRVGTAIRAAAPGRFLRRHPLRDADLVRPGELVAAGATLGLLAIGSVLMPVTMPEDGFVLSLAPAGGPAVGWGETLLEIVTLAELRSTGIT